MTEQSANPFTGRNMAAMAEGLKRSSETMDVTQSPIYQTVLSHLGSDRTVIDIGAGVGRFTVPLAEADCSVTAIEPAEEMLGHLRNALARSQAESRVQVMQGTWPLTQVIQAEVALAAFVIQFSPDYAAFARAMEATATKHCVLAVHVDPIMGFLEPLWPLFHPDEPAPKMPGFVDIYPVLLQAGILADVHIFSETQEPRWTDPAQAVPMIAARLGIQDDPTAVAKLSHILQERKEEMTRPRKHRAAIISWSPTQR